MSPWEHISIGPQLLTANKHLICWLVCFYRLFLCLLYPPKIVWAFIRSTHWPGCCLVHLYNLFSIHLAWEEACSLYREQAMGHACLPGPVEPCRNAPRRNLVNVKFLHLISYIKAWSYEKNLSAHDFNCNS